MKTVSLLLATLLVYNPVVLAAQAAPVSGTTPVQTRETQKAAKFKADVQKHGTGEKARVKVTLRDKTQMKGSIVQIEDSSFSIRDEKARGTKTISYADVERIQGSGLSKGANIAIGVGVGVALVVIVLFAIGRAAASGG